MTKLMHNEFIKYRYFYLVILGLAFLMIFTLPASMSGADGREYLRWTHSLVFDLDLHLLNNLEAVGGSYKLTPTGYVFDRVNIGAPLMWSPFFVLASLFLPQPSDGEFAAADSTINLIWLNFSSWLYPILGGLLTIGALRRSFTPTVLTQTGIAILFGTPMLFYMMIFPMSAHPGLIFLSSLLLYLWLSNRPTDQADDQLDRQLSSKLSGFLSYLTIGIVIGWMMLVASYNIVFFVLPGFDLLRDFINQKNWQRMFQNGCLVGLGGLIGFLPQMIVWWFLFGSPFYSPYSGQLFWSEPYLPETLFSTFHGLFFYAPVLLLVIPGLWWWRRQDAWAALSIGLVWLLLTYIVSVNVAWWAGSSFGNRYFLTLTPFFVLGLSAFIQKGKKWAVALVVPAVLWTIGLYLQFLSGVRVTSDSVVYSAVDLAGGQLTAFAGILSILPRLAANQPWPFVSPVALPLFVLILLVVSRAIYGWAVDRNKPVGNTVLSVITACSLGIVVFVGLAGLRGEQAKAALASSGFFDQPHQVIRREVKEVAGKAGLVTRALYHRQTGQPEKAVADLKLASELWKPDGVEQPSRLFLGLRDAVALNLPLTLHLDYPGQVRLVGYRILVANQEFIQGELFWEKLGGEESEEEVNPIIRAFDRSGNLLASTTVEFPFPAYYLPPGSLFKDSFDLQLGTASDEWAWLQVAVSEDLSLPTNAGRQVQSGFIASVNLASQQSNEVEPLSSGGQMPKIQNQTIYRLIEADFPRRYEPSTPQHPLDTLLTSEIKLAGYDLSVIPQLDSMVARLILHWNVLNNITQNYLVSVQLLDASGQPVLTHTAPPAYYGPRPTSTWLKGEWILDEHVVEIPLLAPDNYRLGVSLINEQTGLPLQNGSGPAQLILQDIQIP